jgi:hypothetical protein
MNASATESSYVKFKVFTSMTVQKAVFSDVTPCGSCKNRHLRGTYRFHHQSGKNNVSINKQPKHSGCLQEAYSVTSQKTRSSSEGLYSSQDEVCSFWSGQLVHFR